MTWREVLCVERLLHSSFGLVKQGMRFYSKHSWLFFLLSLIALSLLPLAVKKLKPDENALSIGQVFPLSLQ